MPVSPQDYALWAEATGNPYPKTAQEKARLAPVVYDFNRGFGKFKGFDEVQGFQSDTVYDQPASIRYFGENTLLQSPITPDNNVPKVAGQLNNTLTGQHYSQYHADDAYETGFGGTERPKSLLEKAALGALGVGAAAAGVYGAQKLTGRDLGVGRIGGMVRNLGERAKSGLKSALGLAKEAADPSFVTREGAENVLAVAQHGTSAIDDVAPGLVRGQNVVPEQIRVNQTLKSRIPDPWGESVLGGGGQTMSAPAQQSVVATQTSGAGLDPDIQSRIGQFQTKYASLFGTPEGAPYNQQTFFGPTNITPVPGQADEAYAKLVKSAGPARKTVLSGIDPQTKRPYTSTALRSELMSSKAEQLLDPQGNFIGYRSTPILNVPGKVGTISTSSVVPERPVVLGSYPGTEGSSGQGVQFTALQGMVGSQPYRYTVLPSEAPSTGESVAEFLQRIDTPEGLGGLLAPQRPIRKGSLTGVQRVISSDKRVGTVQKQAEAIYQATGDPGVIPLAYSETPSLPIRVSLPSGETVPTRNLFEPFGVTQTGVYDPYTGNLTYSGPTKTELAQEALQGAQNMYSKIKARSLDQLNLPSTYQPSQQQLSRLDPRTKELLNKTSLAVKVAQANLADAEANALLYKLKPEITEGIREVPIVSASTGEVIGSQVVPEVEGIPTSKYYGMRSRGGVGRSDTGGIGRRRESVQELEGLSFGLGQGSLEDVTPVLYQGVDDLTGRPVVLRPEDVSPMQIAAGIVRPISGTSVEAPRILGQEGRSFKGVASNVIDPASFDPAMLSQLAEAMPERIDPTSGLAYSEQAMGGRRIAQQRRQVEAARQSGRRVPSRINPGTTIPASVRMNTGVSESGVSPTLGTRFSNRQPPQPGSPRAQQAQLLRERAELERKVLSGEITLPTTPSTEVVPVPISYPQGTKRGTASPAQKALRRYASLVGNPNEL